MTVTSVQKNLEARTVTIVAEFEVGIDRAWQLWADPRQIERWWSPPSHPITIVEHDLRAGGTVAYSVTSPEGDHWNASWHIVAAEPPRRLAFELGDPNMLATVLVRVSVDELPGGGARMTIESSFPSIEAMDQLISIGFAEGMTAAVGQIDAMLEADAGAAS
jgi:uncharacterized protein YndB with AHSA1/START domain